MTKQIMIWNWEPFVSVGFVRFWEPIKPLIKKYALEKELEDDVTGWDTYNIPNCETAIYVEDSCIIAVGCYENLLYQGKNLLGLSLSEIYTILGKETEIGEILGEKTPIEYENFGLQLWLREGVVVDATCYGLIEDD